MDNWYVIQVAAGMELDIKKKLKEKGISSIVPIENRVIRKSKKWIMKEYVIFPGYIFINTEYDWSTYYILSGINGVIRILGNGYEPIPLSSDEKQLITETAELFCRPSVIRFHDNEYEIVSGVLSKLKPYIKNIDKHSRRALVEMTILGKKAKFRLSFLTAKTNAAV